MTDPKRNPELELQNLLAGLAESIAELPYEELIAEMREAGEDPVRAAEEVREALRSTLKRHRQRNLRQAKEQYRATVETLSNRKYELPKGMAEKREILGDILALRPELGALTAQWRDLRSIPDTDIDGILEQLGALGVLDDRSPKS
jgi:hypothetical protein